MSKDTAISTAACPQCVKAERNWDHRDCQCGCHERPGERERIDFHVHEFEHGCYGRQCAEAYRLYAAWQAAIACGRAAPGGAKPGSPRAEPVRWCVNGAPKDPAWRDLGPLRARPRRRTVGGRGR